MGKRYDIVFLTNIPSFYKIRLFNEVAERKRILVLFTNVDSISRENDFFDEAISFPYKNLSRNPLVYFFQLIRILLSHYDKIVGSGWDSLPFWIAALFSPKRKNACIIESSIYDTPLKGIKTILKKIYLSRMDTAFVPGKSNKRLVESLTGKGKCRIIEYGGCGLLNYVQQPSYEPRKEVKVFLYVGRLAEEKNLRILLDVFNELPDLKLLIVGQGALKDSLRNNANSNIQFLGSMKNKELKNIYRIADVFILPSKYEPWGLVVEEALNNGTPVIVSDKVGCKDDLVTVDTGLVFSHNSPEDLKEKIKTISNVSYYNQLRLGVSRMDFTKRSQLQVESFCSL